MHIALDLIVDDAVETEGMPELAMLEAAVTEAARLAGQHGDGEAALRVVNVETMASLNGQWRDKPRPTNVLAFATEEAAELFLPPDQPRLLGDIIVCAEVVSSEAAAQEKTLAAHWTHMVVHGALHLLGFDHIDDTDAARMESLERATLAQFDFADPYR